MNCTQCREALSARLDGEESEAERDAIDAHLATCAACHRFAEDAARITRLTRTAVATEQPDLVEAVLAVAPRSRRPQLVTALRVLLGLVGLAQAEMALVSMLGPHTSDPGAQGVVLQGASLAHLVHESAAWNLALGVGFLWVAWRSLRTSGMVPMLSTFVAVLTVVVVMDTMAGAVDIVRLLGHGLVLLGLILMIALDRLSKPAGGTAPGMRTLRRRRMGRARPADAEIRTGVEGLPPDLRPTAQHDETAVAHRRTA
ncbi:MAG: zf-HC2 domain-containing protein [Pseudonocardiaceae bacterium]